MAQAYIDCPGLRCIYDIPMAERDGFFYRAGLRYIAEHPGEALVTDLRKPRTIGGRGSSRGSTRCPW